MATALPSSHQDLTESGFYRVQLAKISLKHRLAEVFRRLSAGMTGIDLRRERYEHNGRWKLVEFEGMHHLMLPIMATYFGSVGEFFMQPLL